MRGRFQHVVDSMHLHRRAGHIDHIIYRSITLSTHTYTHTSMNGGAPLSPSVRWRCPMVHAIMEDLTLYLCTQRHSMEISIILD